MDEILEIPNFFHHIQYRQFLSVVTEHTSLDYRYRTSPSTTVNLFDENTKDSPVFIHRLCDSTTKDGKFVKVDYPINKTLYPADFQIVFENKLSNLFNKKVRVIRLSINIQPANTTYDNTTTTCPPHVDRPDQHYTAVYYLNTCDGDTTIYNERCIGDEVDTFDKLKKTLKTKEFTVAKKITPLKNKVVIFDGLRYHSASPSKVQTRIVMNVNFIFEE